MDDPINPASHIKHECKDCEDHFKVHGLKILPKPIEPLKTHITFSKYFT